MATIDTHIERISTKSGVPIDEVKTAYQSALNALPVNMPASKRTKRALQTVNADLVSGGRSPAISYNVIIVGAGPARDMNANKRASALEAFNTNATQAETDGLIKRDGDDIIVLDNLKQFKNGNDNPNFGKALKEAWIRTAVAAARLPSDEKYTGVNLQIRGELAQKDVPLNSFIATRFLGDLEKGLRTSDAATNLVSERELTGEELQVITDQAFETHEKTLDEAFVYVQDIKGKPGFYDRYIITEGSVGMIKKTTDPSKNHFMLINDISVDKAVSCFVPYELGGMLNVGRKSLLTIVAQPNIGKGWDTDAKKQTDEDVLQLNVLGIQHIPGMVKPLEVSTS